MSSNKENVSQPLMKWYETHARTLPWRTPMQSSGKPDPYHVWISEIMLQQTRVEAVKGYYQRFLTALPDITSLAAVPEDDLMKLWQGLGYYNRARNLQKAARIIVEKYEGIFPQTYEQLLDLPGFGEYTAGAVASIAFGYPVPAIDGNVYRIYTRLHAIGEDITRTQWKRQIRAEIQSQVPEEHPGAFNQAWMDLGATVCIPNGQPLCSQCPLQQFCLAHQQGNEQAYPYKPPKKSRRVEEWTILLLEYDGKYLLQKRPPKGLLAGLWEFPGQEGLLDLQEMTERMSEWGIPTEQITLYGKAKHIFSHVEWHMLGYGIHCERIPEELLESGRMGEAMWVTLEQMEEQYSIPSAYKYYYEKLMSITKNI